VASSGGTCYLILDPIFRCSGRTTRSRDRPGAASGAERDRCGIRATYVSQARSSGRRRWGAGTYWVASAVYFDFLVRAVDYDAFGVKAVKCGQNVGLCGYRHDRDVIWKLGSRSFGSAGRCLVRDRTDEAGTVIGSLGDAGIGFRGILEDSWVMPARRGRLQRSLSPELAITMGSVIGDINSGKLGTATLTRYRPAWPSMDADVSLTNWFSASSRPYLVIGTIAVGCRRV
jgi:hypothetical protein